MGFKRAEGSSLSQTERNDLAEMRIICKRKDEKHWWKIFVLYNENLYSKCVYGKENKDSLFKTITYAMSIHMLEEAVAS
ncbi:hypothetical protein AGMMS50249_4490 [candidate division SR1 bacterium]|nr:hypothetical protein AGMMS50249_4490 [candidate division SR1 bacterium]